MIRLTLYAWFALSLLISGCKQVNDPPDDSGPFPVAGGYVGLAQIADDYVNVELEIAEDSLQLSGTISYYNQELILSNVYTDSEGDTLWFTYMRGMQQYRVWAGVFDTGLDLHFLEPAGFPTFAVNRKYSGYNLSGYWSGQINNSQQSTTATFFADQRGTAILGTMTANFFVSINSTFTRGTFSGPDFILHGTGEVDGLNYTISVSGRYSNANTILGTWANDGLVFADSGEFVMSRSF